MVDEDDADYNNDNGDDDDYNNDNGDDDDKDEKKYC